MAAFRLQQQSGVVVTDTNHMVRKASNIYCLDLYRKIFANPHFSLKCDI